MPATLAGLLMAQTGEIPTAGDLSTLTAFTLSLRETTFGTQFSP
jgi:hypothetical protein